MRFAITVSVAVVLLAACAPTPTDKPPKDSAGTAQALSQLATTPEQARLWTEAAGTGTAAGLEKIPVAEHPVQLRKRVVAPDQAIKPRPVGLPEGLRAGIRIVGAPALKEDSFSGTVQVRSVDAERLELDLGQQRILTLYARVRGGPMRAQAGQKAELDYRVRDDPFDRRQVVALRVETGDGIASILEGGSEPVTVQIPLFQLVASQVGKPEEGTMAVEVQIGSTKQVLTQGQIVEFPEHRLTVGVVASSAYVGADAYRAEGNPYAIRLVAWSGE